MKRRFPLPKGSHGESVRGARTPEFNTWVGMRNRCEVPTMTRYERYGGRGIKVCARWQTFEHFLGDMGRRPSTGHSLDRIDNDGDYEPANCRWATRAEQNANKRQRSSSFVLEHEGRSLNLSEWSRIVGINTSVMRKRLQRGWSAAQTLGVAVAA